MTEDEYIIVQAAVRSGAARDLMSHSVVPEDLETSRIQIVQALAILNSKLYERMPTVE